MAKLFTSWWPGSRESVRERALGQGTLPRIFTFIPLHPSAVIYFL
jgi:hypothetical protein